MSSERPPYSIPVESLESLGDAQPRLIIYGGEWFLAHQAPPITWAIPGLLEAGVPTVLAAKGGMGKSFAALQMCIAAATGKPVLGYDAVDPMGAIFFGVEDSRAVVHRRFSGIVDDYRASADWAPDDEDALRLNFAAPFINWQAQKATTYLPDLIPELNTTMASAKALGVRPGIIVFDTLARMSEGDENTVQALRPILAAVMRVAEEGWTPVVLHHVGKGQDGAKSKDKPTVADRMSTEWVRGSSAIVDSFRCVIQMAAIREDEADPAGLDSDRARSGDYVIFGATKTNSPKSDWKLLERREHGGWGVHPDSLDTLARLRGKRAVADLGKQDALLVECWEASRAGREPDRRDLSLHLFRDATKPEAALRLAVLKLRRAGFIQKETLRPTSLGVSRAIEKQGGNAGGNAR